jgi:hypothetical protein
VVQVELEDLVLAEAAIDLAGDADLEQLALQRARAPGDALREQVARDLHGDRAEALLEGSRTQVGARSSGHPAPVDSGVIVETSILHREERLPHRGGQRRELDHARLGRKQVRDRLAVAVEQQRSALELAARQGAHVGAAVEAAGVPRAAQTEEGDERCRGGTRQRPVHAPMRSLPELAFVAHVSCRSKGLARREVARIGPPTNAFVDPSRPFVARGIHLALRSAGRFEGGRSACATWC